MCRAETVNSFFHLCGCGNPRNHANSNVVATGLAEIDEDWHT
jgi:hypothetical protein